MGLLLGQKRSGGGLDLVADRSNKGASNVGAVARELYASAPFAIVNQVMTRFVGKRCELLQRARVPWFMPEWLGGLGLPAFFNTRDLKAMGPTQLDLAKGASIYWNHLDQIRTGTEAAWKIHKLVMSRMPERPLSAVTSPLVQRWRRRYDSVYAALAVSLLFDSRIRLSDLLDEAASSGVRNLRVNERLWSRAAPLGRDAVDRVRARITGPPPDVVSTLPIRGVLETPAIERFVLPD